MSGILGSVRQLFSGRSATLKQAKQLMSAKSYKEFKAGDQLNHQTDKFVAANTKMNAKKQQRLADVLGQFDKGDSAINVNALLSKIDNGLRKPRV